MKLKSYYLLLFVIGAVGCLSRCSDDDASVQIYMPEAKSVVYANFDQDGSVEYTATIVGADYPTVSSSAGNDVTVEFKVDPDKVASFNQQMGTTYTLLPLDNFAIETSGIIAKGNKSTDPLKLSIKNGNQLDPFSSYLLPVTIDKVNGGEPSTIQRTTFFVLTRSPALENLPAYDRAAWTIAEKSTEEPAEGNGNGLAIAAIDGNWKSYWHTKWAGGEPAPPHHLVINMGEEKTIHGVSVVDRDLGAWAHGQPKSIVVAVSKDGINFEGNYTFDVPMKSDPQTEIRFFLPSFKSGKFLRIQINSTWGDTNSSSLGEIYAL